MAGNRRQQGIVALVLVNSEVPNWKPGAVFDDQHDPVAVPDEAVASGRAIVEIDADEAVVSDAVRACPLGSVVSVGVGVTPVGLIARFRTVIKFDNPPVQKIVHLGPVQEGVAGPETILRESKAWREAQKKE